MPSMNLSRLAAPALVLAVAVAPAVGEARTAKSTRESWTVIKEKRPRGINPSPTRPACSPPTASGTAPWRPARSWIPARARASRRSPTSSTRQRRLPPSLGGGKPNVAADEFSTPIYRVSKRARRVPVRLPPEGSSPALRADPGRRRPDPRQRGPRRRHRRTPDRLAALVGHAVGVLARPPGGRRLARQLGRGHARRVAQPRLLHRGGLARAPGAAKAGTGAPPPPACPWRRAP